MAPGTTHRPPDRHLSRRDRRGDAPPRERRRLRSAATSPRRGSMRTIRLMSAVLAGAAVVAVVGVSAQAAPRTVRSTALIKTVNVTATEFKFVLSSSSAGRGLVIFRVKN